MKTFSTSAQPARNKREYQGFDPGRFLLGVLILAFVPLTCFGQELFYMRNNTTCDYKVQVGYQTACDDDSSVGSWGPNTIAGGGGISYTTPSSTVIYKVELFQGGTLIALWFCENPDNWDPTYVQWACHSCGCGGPDCTGWEENSITVQGNGHWTNKIDCATP